MSDPKYQIGERLGHSTYGDGTIAETKVVMDKPKEADLQELRRKELSLMSDLASIRERLVRGNDERPLNVYVVEFDLAEGVDPSTPKKRVEFPETSIPKLKDRLGNKAKLAADSDEH